MHHVYLHLLHLERLGVFRWDHLLRRELLATARAISILVDLRWLAAALGILPLH